ncbi:MAG: hypothetical protein R3D33_18505 [Hyphomicrobiaceae bacterium]
MMLSTDPGPAATPRPTRSAPTPAMPTPAASLMGLGALLMLLAAFGASLTPAAATGRSITVAAIGGTEEITLPLRTDSRGDDEVYVPNRGWTRCVYRDCAYTVRMYYFDRGEPRGHGIGRGILGDLIGIW